MRKVFFWTIKKMNEAEPTKGHNLFFLIKRIKGIIGKGKKEKVIEGLWWCYIDGLPILLYIYIERERDVESIVSLYKLFSGFRVGCC